MTMAKTAKKKVTFTYTAPEAQTVFLAADFTNWQQAPLALKKGKSGVWKKTVSLVPGAYQYRFVVDGEWRDDPLCPNREYNSFGTQNCVCVVDGA